MSLPITVWSGLVQQRARGGVGAQGLSAHEPWFFPATEDYGHYEELPGQPGETVFPEHPLEPDSFSEGGAAGRAKPGAGVPDFLPSAQRALYLRIQQKQQEEEERARRLAESSKQDRENEEGMCPGAGEGALPGLQGRCGCPGRTPSRACRPDSATACP
jgi:hypothetical protein